LGRYARAHHLRFVNYYAHLVSSTGGFRRTLSNDGVHPNRNGFKVMSALARAAIDKPWRHRWARGLHR
jgi:lysophospholipase L1-like esterase